MARSLIWIQGGSDPGWACSTCPWRYPLPTLLGSEEARSAYDRLAAAKFRDHKCETQSQAPTVKARTEPTFAERAGKLIKAGYKPRDAADLVMQDILLEHGHDASAKEQARVDADEFLLRVRKGLI
jgi:hypothetical protein